LEEEGGEADHYYLAGFLEEKGGFFYRPDVAKGG